MVVSLRGEVLNPSGVHLDLVLPENSTHLWWVRSFSESDGEVSLIFRKERGIGVLEESLVWQREIGGEDFRGRAV